MMGISIQIHKGYELDPDEVIAFCVKAKREINQNEDIPFTITIRPYEVSIDDGVGYTRPIHFQFIDYFENYEDPEQQALIVALEYIWDKIK
jgi:hypothetical protein